MKQFRDTIATSIAGDMKSIAAGPLSSGALPEQPLASGNVVWSKAVEGLRNRADLLIPTGDVTKASPQRCEFLCEFFREFHGEFSRAIPAFKLLEEANGHEKSIAKFTAKSIAKFTWTVRGT